jgi:hypothetical protein
MKRTSPTQSNSVARWKIHAECKSLHTDLLSARCIVDRLRLHYGTTLVADCADQSELKKVAANLLAIVSFVQSIEEALASPASFDEDQASEPRPRTK